MLFYFLHFTISFISTVLFSIIFNAPKRLLVACGFVGAIAWTIYQLTVDLEFGKVGASFGKQNFRLNQSYYESQI